MELEVMLDLNSEKAWRPPVVRTVANAGEGIQNVADAIHAHGTYLKENGIFEKKRKMRVEMELLEVLNQCITKKILRAAQKNQRFDTLVTRIAQHKMDYYTAAEELLETQT